MIPVWPAPYGQVCGCRPGCRAHDCGPECQMCRELPYNLRTVAELECEPAWVQALYLDEPALGAEFPPLCSHELVPGGGVSSAPVAPGTHQDADGAVEAPADGAAGTAVGVPPGEWPGAAPSVQTPAAPAWPRSADPGLGIRRIDGGGGPDVVLWAAVATALVITTVFAAARVAQDAAQERSTDMTTSGIVWDK